ncbi:MAG: N-acetylmuramoyl-L-alanine amidase [Bacillales bacterium]
MTIKLVDDPGHGGKDPGAIGYDKKTTEKDVVLKAGLLFRKHLSQYEGVEVIMTRDDDTFVSLSRRADIANDAKANYFISLHNNSYSDPDAGGFETFIYNGPVSSNTIKWRDIIHSRLAKYVGGYGVRDRGKKRANFAVLRETAMPAVLIEMAFISNPRELSLLKNDSFLDGFAKELAAAVAEIFGLKKKPAPAPEPSGTVYNRFYVDGKKIGSFTSHDNVVDLVKENLGKYKDKIVIERFKM